MREREVERHLVKRCEEAGIMCVKFIPDDMNGMPDRLLLLPDTQCVWVEVKRDSGRLRPIQRYTHELLRRRGQAVYVVWNTSQVDELIAEIEKRMTA